jgi:hypothetical protein
MKVKPIVIFEDLGVASEKSKNFANLVSNSRRLSILPFIPEPRWPLCYGCGEEMSNPFHQNFCSKYQKLKRTIDFKFVFKDQENPQATKDLLASMGYQPLSSE